jgi:hypothetical protein
MREVKINSYQSRAESGAHFSVVLLLEVVQASSDDHLFDCLVNVNANVLPFDNLENNSYNLINTINDHNN